MALWMNQISAFCMSIISLLLFLKCSSHAPIEDFLNPAFQLPWWLRGEESACSAERQVCSLAQEDPLEQSLATHPLQYSCLGNPMDREASTVQEVVKSWTPLKWLRIAFNKLLIYLISKLDFCRAFFQTSLCNISYSSGVALSCPTLCDPMDNCLLDSSVHGIFQARVLEWVAISFSRGSSWPRDRTWVSCIVDRHFTVGATREVISY